MSPPPDGPSAVSPRRLTELATGYWASMVLLSLNELEVFGALTTGPRAAAELAQELECDLRAITLALNAGVALGLLEVAGEVADGRRYSNAAEAQAFLVPGSPTFLGGAFKYAFDVFPVWARLAKGIRTGQPQVPEEEYLGGDTARTERFVRAMHGRAMGVGRSVAAAVDVSGHQRLLDIAGGSGAYSVLFCRQTPGLTATVCDLPGVIAVAEGILREEGLEERVATHPWDLRQDPLPSGHDVALVSGLLHRLSGAEAQDLLNRVFAALRPGGRVVLADVMLDDEGTGPVPAALFALNMLLTAPGGGAHRIQDHIEWLDEAGFVRPEVVVPRPPSLHCVVTAHRP